MSSRRGVGIAATLLLLLGSLGLTLAAIEVGLRLFYPLGGEPDIHEFDPELGHHIRPNLDLVQIWDNHENVSRIRTNELGLRSPTIPPEKAPGEYRILLLGDSYTFGYGVAAEDTFGARLEGRLNARGDASRRFVVINAGVSAYGTAQELLQYEMVGRAFHPDLVMLAFFVGNDIQDNLCLELRSLRPTTRPPCFGLRDGQLIELSKPAKDAGKPAEPPGVLAKALGSFRDLELQKLVRQRGVPLLVETPGLVRFFASIGLDFDPGYLPHVAAGWYSPGYAERGWALTRALIERLQADTAADGARLVLILIPSRVQVLPKLSTLLPVLYPDSAEVAALMDDPTKPQRLMLDFAAKRGIPAFDLMPSIVSRGNVSELYYPAIAHWTELGHAIAAAAIDEFLEKESVIEGGPPSQGAPAAQSDGADARLRSSFLLALNCCGIPPNSRR
jgi:hypothetical protein